MRQILNYPGGKARIAPWIVQHFPEHQVYCEPFGGSAAVLLEKQPSRLEIYNDLNGDLVNFLEVLASEPEALLKAIDDTHYVRLGEEIEAMGGRVENARRFFRRNSTTWFDGVFKTQRRAQERLVTDVFEDRKGALPLASNRLKRVIFEQMDAVAFIQKYDAPDVLFYCDPPYLGQRKRNLYAFEMMDEESHRKLAEVLHRCRGAVVLSGYASEIYQELYGDWTVSTRHAQTHAKVLREECLWIKPGSVVALSSVKRIPVRSAAKVVRGMVRESGKSPTNGKVLPEGRPKKLLTVSSFYSQKDRAIAKGISRSSQQILDKIARLRPELLKRIADGECSIRAAERLCKEAQTNANETSNPDMKGHPYYNEIEKVNGIPVYELVPGCLWESAIKSMVDEARTRPLERMVYLRINGVVVPVFGSIPEQVLAHSEVLRKLKRFDPSGSP